MTHMWCSDLEARIKALEAKAKRTCAGCINWCGSHEPYQDKPVWGDCAAMRVAIGDKVVGAVQTLHDYACPAWEDEP